MKAVRIHSTGDASVLHFEKVPTPQIGTGEVLIHVRAAGVNPVDCKIRSGEMHPPHIEFPLTLGRDVSGIVEEVAAGEGAVKVGDEVYAFLGPRSGGYAEYAVARVSELALKPRTLDHAHAAAVPLAATTAWQALFDQGKLQRGERVLIHGAAGGVGHFAVQLAKACGSTVVATASGEDIGMLKELGADEVIDYKHERFEDQARDIDLVLDLVAGETQERSWNVLKNGGRMVSTVAQPSEQQAAAHHANGLVFIARPRGDELTEISRLIDNGAVSVIVSAELPLSEARMAHEKLEHEHTRGKMVLTVA